MTVAPARSFTRLAIAIVIAAIVIGAGIFAASYLGTATTVTRTTTITSTSTELCGQQLGNVTEAYITNCQLGVTLFLGIENPSIPGGNNETFSLSVRNDLGSNNTLTQENPILPAHISPLVLNSPDYILPLSPECGQFAWIVVYNESGLPVQLNDAIPHVYVCGELSSGLPPIQFATYQTISQSISLGGYWHSSNATAPWEDATYGRFAAGQYTVIMFDRWTQPIMLNFTVG